MYHLSIAIAMSHRHIAGCTMLSLNSLPLSQLTLVLPHKNISKPAPRSAFSIETNTTQPAGVEARSAAWLTSISSWPELVFVICIFSFSLNLARTSTSTQNDWLARLVENSSSAHTENEQQEGEKWNALGCYNTVIFKVLVLKESWKQV